MNTFQIAAYQHHVVIGIPLAGGGTWDWWLTPQDADALSWAIGEALAQLGSEQEGRMYAGDLFTYEIGQAMTQTGVRVVDVGEVEA
mgnify:CR=1 FL=1